MDFRWILPKTQGEKNPGWKWVENRLFCLGVYFSSKDLKEFEHELNGMKQLQLYHHWVNWINWSKNVSCSYFLKSAYKKKYLWWLFIPKIIFFLKILEKRGVRNCFYGFISLFSSTSWVLFSLIATNSNITPINTSKELHFFF